MVERINGKTILTTPISAEDLKGIKNRRYCILKMEA